MTASPRHAGTPRCHRLYRGARTPDPQPPADRRAAGQPVRVALRRPPVAVFAGRAVRRLSRLGKRIVMGFDEELFLVIHLMIAGRLYWRAPGAPLARKIGLAAFDFADGTLVLTEVASKKRTSIHAVRGTAALAEHDPGGMDVFSATLDAFRVALLHENRTLKRVLNDPRLFSGISNAYSDEILHRSKLSPIKMTRSLDDEEIERLLDSTRATLTEWIERLREQTGEGFPEKVTAFRPEMAVHGRFGKPCPVCGAPVQRIV